MYPPQNPPPEDEADRRHYDPAKYHSHPTENAYQNAYNGFQTYDMKDGEPSPPDRGHKRSAYNEPSFINFDPNIGRWTNGIHVLGRDFKPKKYWARPVDGRRRGTFGRLMDGLTGEGPDVFVVLNGDRRTLHRDMPHRAQWSRWGGAKWDVNHNSDLWDPDHTLGEKVHFKKPWSDRNRQWYNFKTRKYDGAQKTIQNHMSNNLWTDAHWAPGAKGKNNFPTEIRDGFGQRAGFLPPGVGMFPGGRPRTPYTES
ncbi:Hypothetical protein R9X50_00205400 [Acrodontium crateriforme]|uniref:Uncharacterized protein n=1 Tax=Acrodontium crateriforme TaxID=150365 RepID=A0AAQ3M0I6_9PEZI|nr:Hypothetical protein R9X50_00205400 [Acrodontium crateriforme]